MINSNEISHPRRSTLYNLEPMGIGTLMVESLTSYLLRLSNVHNLKTRSLIQYLIYPFLNKSTYDLKKSNNNIYSDGRFLDGSTPLTIEFINALETLTHRKDLRYLTLISWGGITNHKVITPYKKWCPQCLSKMKIENGTVYQPLLWNVKHVKICPLHNIQLRHTCPSCGSSQLALNTKGSISTCNSCNTWLGKDEYNYEEVNVSDFDRWVASAIGDLIRETPKILRFPIGSYIDELVKKLEGVIPDITIPFDNILVFLANKNTKKSDIASSLRLALMESDSKHKDHFYDLLRFIFILGVPIQTIYDCNSLSTSSLPIMNDLKDCKKKYLRKEKLFRDFDYIIYKFNPLPSPEEILRLTGDADNLLVEYIDNFIEDKNSLIEYNKEN
ncbi:TniQ family protein [Oceanobacillus sp. M65]|uniref:TniQ family protein n=1 Tax=Oceanobacillus sp. M65 TaxID=3457435 RepID=UPI003FCE09BC